MAREECVGCGSRMHFRCIPAVPECTAKYHGTGSAIYKFGCVCPDAKERLQEQVKKSYNKLNTPKRRKERAKRKPRVRAPGAKPVCRDCDKTGHAACVPDDPQCTAKFHNSIGAWYRGCRCLVAIVLYEEYRRVRAERSKKRPDDIEKTIQEKYKGKKMIDCPGCLRRRPSSAKGLCNTCYVRSRDPNWKPGTPVKSKSKLNPCRACGSYRHISCVPFDPACTAAYHGSVLTAWRNGCICQESLEAPRAHQKKIRTKTSRYKRRKAFKRKAWKETGSTNARSYAQKLVWERRKNFVDEVVVMRSLEGERGLITCEAERNEVVRQATLKGWPADRLAWLLGIKEEEVPWLRKKLGVKFEGEYPTEASRRGEFWGVPKIVY